MNSNLTEMVFILDRSGSMHGLEGDTIGGFNTMIDKQRKEEGEALVSTVLFANESEVLYDRVPLDKVEPMTDRQYVTRGCTALLDAIGGAIRHIRNIHKYAREEDIPAHTVFTIITDGLENASHRVNRAQVKKMIEEQQQKGWEFLFIGANIDAIGEAGRLGIDQDNAVDYMPDGRGTEVVYEGVHMKMQAARAGRPRNAKWKQEIARDVQERKKN